jgi:hypothetical protein
MRRQSQCLISDVSSHSFLNDLLHTGMVSDIARNKEANQEVGEVFKDEGVHMLKGCGDLLTREWIFYAIIIT